jgi:hypothetical protein
VLGGVVDGDARSVEIRGGRACGDDGTGGADAAEDAECELGGVDSATEIDVEDYEGWLAQAASGVESVCEGVLGNLVDPGVGKDDVDMAVIGEGGLEKAELVVPGSDGSVMECDVSGLGISMIWVDLEFTRVVGVVLLAQLAHEILAGGLVGV